MKSYSASNIRNIAVLGHSGCGKTTLMEAMLHLTGVTTRMGRVEDGNTVSDYDAEEIRRGGSVSASIIPIEWADSKINFIDTPGYFDFVGAVLEGLHVSDAALIFASAKSGIEVGCEISFEQAEGLPRAFFVNNMDDEHADYFKVLGDIQSMFACGVPLMLPITTGGKFTGFVDVLTGAAYNFADKGQAKIDIPAELADAYEEHHAALVEAIAGSDEELMEKFFADEPLTPEEMAAGLKAGVASGGIVPIYCGAATLGLGAAALLNMLCEQMPSAAESKPVTATLNGKEVELSLDGRDPAAFVFKTISDPFVGRLSLFRVYAGSIKKDTPIYNTAKDSAEKAGHLFYVRGKEQIEASQISAGDIGAIAKLTNTNTSDTLATKAVPYVAPAIEFPQSLLMMAVSAKGKGDEDKLSSTLQKIMAEDRTLKFFVNTETKQTVISAIGDAQLDVLMSKLKGRYKMDVELKPPLVPYRETIKGRSDVKGKFVKQTGGGGQYGIVDMRFEPSGDIEKPYIFEQVVVGGNVPKNFFPAVEKGISESCKAGPVAAYPVVGVKAVLYDGKYHAVDSSELAFKMAATLAFKDGFVQANPKILEPIMRVKVSVPEDYTGDIMGDMNKRRGRILGMEMVGKKQEISAEAPHAELVKYAIDLRSMTQGRGSFTMDFDRYDEAPQDVQTKVIAARKEELAALRDA